LLNSNFTSTNFDVEGKGLGLYMAKTQFEALVGNVEVESELDKGSTFKFYLPI